MTAPHPPAAGQPPSDRGSGWRSDDPGDRQRRQAMAPAGDRQPASPDRQPVASPAGDRQPPAEATASPDHPLVPTHRIVTPPPADEPAGDRQPGDDDWDAPLTRRERAEDLFRGWFDGLRFVREPPGSLRDQIDYAKNGAYTVASEGLLRRANIVFAHLVATPGLTVLYFAAWAYFTRLNRAAVAVPLTVVALVLANTVPVVHWLVPDWADLTWWLGRWLAPPDPVAR